MSDIMQNSADPLTPYTAGQKPLKIPANTPPLADPLAEAKQEFTATAQAKDTGQPLADPLAESKQQFAGTSAAVSQLKAQSPWLSNYSGVKISDINRMIAADPDPVGAIDRIGTAAQFAAISKVPLSSALENLDAYSKYWTSKPYIPKTTARVLQDYFNAGKMQMDMGNLSFQWSLSGGGDDGTMAKLDAMQAKIDELSEDSVPRTWIVDALKSTAMSAPGMISGALKGGAVVAGVGLLAAAAGVEYGTKGLGKPLVAAATISGMALIGSSVDMYQYTQGKAYYDLIKQGHSRDVAVAVSSISAFLQSATEGLVAEVPGLGALTGGGGLDDALTKMIAKRTAQSGVFNWVGVALTKMAVETIGEGTEEGIQGGTDLAAQAIAQAIEDVGYEGPAPEDAIKSIAKQFVGGMLVKGIMGGLGGDYVSAFKGEYQQASYIKDRAKSAINQGLDYAQFSGVMRGEYGVAEAQGYAPVLSEFDEDTREQMTKALWEAGKREQTTSQAKAKAAQEKAGLAAPDIGDEEATGAPIVRDTSDRLYTQNRVVTTDDNGEIRSVFKLGDPTAEGKSKRLASIDYETDGETLTISEVTGKIDADTKREFILDLLEQNPGKTVDWRPKSEEDQAIYDGLVRDNPRGPEAGIQWYSEKGTIDKVRTREAMSRQLRTFVGKTDLKAEQIPVMVATVDNFAQSLGMETDELITTMMSDKGFTDQVPSERALRQNARGATSFERVNNALKSVIYFGQKADATTFFHESFHAYQTMLIGNRALNDKFSAKAAEIEDAFGVQGGDWDAEATGLWAESYLKKARAEGRNLSFKEAAAYAFEEYLRTGKAPTEEQRGIFQKIARWFYDVYQAIAPKVKMNADITRVFDSLMGGSGPLAEIAQEGQAQENQPAEALYQPKKAHDKNAAAEQKPRQPANTLPEVYALVEAAREDFTKWTQEIADKYGVEIHARKELKAQNRAARKINAQEGPESILDIDGKTLIAPDMAVIMNIMEDLSGRDEVVRIKDRFAKPAPGNYRDMLLNVKMPNGAIVELQVSSNQLLEAKDTAHVLYEVGDQVLAAVEAGRMEEAKGRQARDAAIEAMKVLNGKAYEATLAGAIFNASALDISEQLVMISENFQEEGAGSSVLSEKTRKKLDELMASALSSQSTKTREGSSIEGVIIGSSTTSIEDAGKGNKPSDLYQGARDIDRVVYTFPPELKAFTDIHSASQFSGILNAFGRGVISPDGKDIRIGPEGTSHAVLGRGMNDAKRFYFGYSREKQAVYVVAKNGIDTDLFKRPAVLKNVLSQIFDKYKLNVAAGKKLQFLDKDVPSVLFQESSDYHIYYPKPRGGYTKEKIIHYLKEGRSRIVSEYGLSKEIVRFDNAEELSKNIYYHGTGGYLPTGPKPSVVFSDREIEQIGGGGYGEKYFAVSLSKSKRKAEAFSGTSISVSIYPVILKKGAHVKDMSGEIKDAADLEDHIVELWNEGVDAVWIGGGEEELAVLNPYAIATYKTADSYAVFGGFKSENMNAEKAEKIYNEAHSIIAGSENIQASIGRKEYISTLPKLLFQEAAPTDSPEFKAWFGKSKVVDDGGKPLVVYHGTEDFKGETFSRAYSQKGPSKLGFWFTDDSNYAEMFGNTKIAVFLSINNPKKITQEKWNDIRGAHGGDAAWFASYRDKIIEQGFDGIMVSAQIDQLGGLEVRTPGVFAAFSPEQIKSVNNRGTWDPADQRILYQPAAPTKTAQAAFDYAAKELGTTDDLNEAGYVLPDGRLLDFSGKKDGGDGGERVMDHRQVVFPGSSKYSSEPSQKMRRFIKFGAIRIDANSGLLDMENVPTHEQWRAIRDMIDGYDVEAWLDLQDGKRTFTIDGIARFDEAKRMINAFYNGNDNPQNDMEDLYQHAVDDLEKSARTFKTWEEFREYWETGIPKDETEQTDDMTPEQRDAFYKNIFEQAAMQEATPNTESIDDEADDAQFSEEIKTDAGLRAYLLDLFGSAYDKDFIRDIERAGASDEEEVARYDAMKRAESIVERSAAPAVYLGAQGVASGKATSKILSAARTIILNNPTEYRRLAALAQGDQETAGRLETKLAKPYILDPRWVQTAATLTIEKRRRLARTIRNEKLARKIARGDITVDDKDLADHIDYLTGEAKALRKSIAEKEAQTQELDDRLGTTQRIALKQERALKEYQDRLALVEKRAKAYQDRQATIPAKTEAERKLLSKQVKDTQAALAKARTDSKTDAAYLESMAATLATQKERNRLKAMEAERRALKGIRDEMRHLAAMATKPLGKNARVILEYKKKIEELQKQLDPAFRTPKTLEKLAHWKDFLMNDPGAAEMMPDHLIRQVQAKPLNDWTLDELKVFKERIDELRQTGAATWKIRHNSEQAARTLMANDFKSSALAGKEFRPSVGRAKPSSIWTKAKLATFRPLALFMELDGDKRGAFTTWFFDKYNEAVAEKNNQTERRKNEVMTKIQELGFTLDPLDAKRTYVGKEVDIDGFTYSDGRKPTIQDVAYWSIGLQNDETKRALLAGNFLTEAIMNKAVQAMTPDQLALAEVISKDFDSNFDRLREAFEYQYNFALNQTSHYVPMRRLEVNYDTRGEEVAVGLVSGTGQVKTFLNKGFTKNRKEITDAFQTSIRTDLVSLWAESIEKEEAFISEDWLIKRLQDVTNRLEVSRSIQQRLGPEGVRWFKKYINDIAQGDANQALTGTQKLMQNLRGRMAVSYLSFNVLSNLKQLVSVLPYIADANPFHIVGAAGQYLAGITGKENKLTAFVHARSDIIKNRKISRDFEDVKRMEASNQANPIIRNAVEIEKRIGAIGMQSLEVIDHVSVCIGWKAVYDNKISKGMSELEAIQAADDATVLTQPSGRVQDMAEIYRSGETMKMFTMFTNALNAQWNMMAYRIPAAIRQKKYLHAVGDAVALALCGLGIALVSGAAYGGDDEDKKKRLVVGLFSQYTDSLPLVGSYVTSALERGAGVKTFVPSGVTPFPWGANVVNTIGAITQGDIDKAFAQAAEGAAYGLGLPVSEPKRVIKAIAEQDPALLLGWKKE